MKKIIKNILSELSANKIPLTSRFKKTKKSTNKRIFRIIKEEASSFKIKEDRAADTNPFMG